MIDELPEGWENDDKVLPADFWDKCILPIWWRILVMPIRPKKVSKGGIVIPVEAQEAQEHLNYIGKVVKMGALATKHERLQGEPNVYKVGDYVIYGRYAGQPLLYRGVKLILANDDEILGVCPDPESLTIYI